MSETANAPAAPQPVPPLAVNLQYVKDLSFEVPGAPGIFASLRSQPQISINLDVQVKRIEETPSVYEVTLAIRAEATEPAAANGADSAKPRSVFLAELAYAGIFTLTNIAPENVEPVLLIECTRLLFPYARNILGDITRESGFPPVLLQPIDFVALWQARRTQQPMANA